jgi:Cu+-exporting ATPase
VLAQIVTMVSNARRSRGWRPVSAVFVPTVVAVAIFAFIVWMIFGPEPALVFAIASAVSVLIIACPCALGLATSISITTAAGAARRRACWSRTPRRWSAWRRSTR